MTELMINQIVGNDLVVSAHRQKGKVCILPNHNTLLPSDDVQKMQAAIDNNGFVFIPGLTLSVKDSAPYLEAIS